MYDVRINIIAKNIREENRQEKTLLSFIKMVDVPRVDLCYTYFHYPKR